MIALNHAEYLADVSSFANTAGGDIVIGMAATKGVPTAFAPLSVDPDAEILRLENIARSGLQPRISNLVVRAVPLTGGCALLIRVPRSYNPPHRIIRQGTGQAVSTLGPLPASTSQTLINFGYFSHRLLNLPSVFAAFVSTESPSSPQTMALSLCQIYMP